MVKKMVKLGFIGVGNMGAAILKGYTSSSAARGTEIYAYEPDSIKVEALRPLGVSFLPDENEVVKICDYIIVAVKPQQTNELFAKIKENICGQVIVSICAGISMSRIEERLSSPRVNEIKIVQVMPNTPMMLGLGACAVSRNENVTDAELSFVLSVLNSSGITEMIPANKMNEIICINGSSPAFIYHFAECFTEYANQHGIDPKVSLRLFAQSLVGAGTMLLNSGLTPSELVSMVTSKGGTTTAGLEVLQKKLGGIVKKTCEACTDRAYELEKSD